MTGDLSLQGKCVLVIEDDYYLATDEAAMLEKAGATVVGCTGNSEEALELIAGGQVDCALVDINLGLGPAFDTARALRAKNIPFLFTTGYDAASIPSEFQDVPHLEKPFDDRRLFGALKALPD